MKAGFCTSGVATGIALFHGRWVVALLRWFVVCLIFLHLGIREAQSGSPIPSPAGEELSTPGCVVMDTLGRLKKSGVTPSVSYTSDSSFLAAGDGRHRGEIAGLLDAHLTLDLDALCGLKGGTFFAQYFFRHGDNGSTNVGDLQGYSNLNAGPLSQIEELWYEQVLCDQRLRIKVGQVDANSEFATVVSAADLIQSSAGYSPTILGLPTYPDPALSLNIFCQLFQHAYVGAGIYGESLQNNRHVGFSDPFCIGEIGFRTEAADAHLPTHVAVGVWRCGGGFTRFDKTIQSGTAGGYAVAEQMLWRESAEDAAQGVTAFLQYGWADENVCSASQHFGLGVVRTGWVPGRDADVCGIYASRAQASRVKGADCDASETAVEGFYSFQANAHLGIKPGVQWINNPGGHADRADAVLATLRVTLSF